MRVIDAHTGDDKKVGDQAGFTDSRYTILSITPGLLSASMMIRWKDGREQKVPLQVRWLHPGFMVQHVAFIPS